MRAARRFKKRHGLHPCVRMECELQAIGSGAILNQDVTHGWQAWCERERAGQRGAA
jgi:hypothetical protein